MKVLIFGAGAVGGTIAAWMQDAKKEVWLFDTKETIESIDQNGLTVYAHDDPLRKMQCKPKGFYNFDSLPSKPDIVFLCVKNFSLDKVAELIKKNLGDVPVVGFQNGVVNQQILPKYFSKTIYGIVAYNAWIDSPGVIGFQKKGPLAVGALDYESKEVAKELAQNLTDAVQTDFIESLQDAAHSKMVVNLTNSLTTLIGHGFRPLEDKALFQKILSQLTYEGVCILKAAGFKEYRLGGMPSWLLITLAAKLPLWLTKPAFEKNIKKMVISSMAQDIIQRGASSSELQSLNGYFVDLAHKYKISAPYNEAILELCQENFKPGFKPLSLSQVWQRVLQRMARDLNQDLRPDSQKLTSVQPSTERPQHHNQKV